MDYKANQLKAKAFIFKVLNKQAGQKGVNWLDQQRIAAEKEDFSKKLYIAFSMASRFFSKDLLRLSEQDQKEANEIRNGFQPHTWNQLQAARAYLLLLFPQQDRESWFAGLQKLFGTADMHEQEALYAALPLMPFPQMLTKQAAEGIRTNITSVFDAIALHNPYPAGYLEENAWNQMVLKAVFMQRPLYKIYRADERANEKLARMLIDFAHERRAAGRAVTPELWRFTGPFLTKARFADIEHIVEQGNDTEKKAGLLACNMSSLEEAKQLLDKFPDIKESVRSGELNWKDIGKSASAGL